MDSDVFADLSLRRLFCDFLSASLLIVMARGEDNLEYQAGIFSVDPEGLVADRYSCKTTLV